ncbi:isochorismatase family protein [Baekduia soli]|uniref:Isochorismatase family protein n=2 Tax=Baekduia soli TaxID=496014 RepID=A0A5B8UCD2_9ACTN|nr:isochorismatase family protein [Baekduia soli]
MGERCAVLVIDVQNYMVGPPPGSTHAYPSACGPVAERALQRIAPLLATARAAGAPVVYTRMELRRDGSDGGVYLRKREPLQTEGWLWEGSEGAAIHASVAPQHGDIVLVKRKPSAFFGTELMSLLVDRGIDTVVVTGGSTANCVRATAVDSASYNFRTVVVEDCVFDRFEVSHLVALFDLDRQYADVRASDEVRAHLERRS